MGERTVAEIHMLPIEVIKPHPHNPRKELGDLTELIDSVKENGILQNLTVVDNGDGSFTAVIGHRRLAAARAAGLKDVPCVITHMDEAKQLATMLAENMQRTDLTVYEQAEGVQLLLDMDFSIKDIADTTGFSESTVRRRAKLMTLDHAKFKASQARQVSLQDYEKLFEIENTDYRNVLLEKIGTADFNNDYKIIMAKEKFQHNFELIKQELADKHVRILNSTESPHVLGYVFFDYYSVSDKLPCLRLTEGDFAAKLNNYGSSAGLTIYRKDDLEKKSTEEDERLRKEKEEKQIKDRTFRTEAEEINKRIRNLRRDFIESFSIKRTNRTSRESLILKMLLENLCQSEYSPECILYDQEGDMVNFESVYDRDGGVLIMLSILEDTMGGGYIYPYDRNNAVKEKEDVSDLNRWYYLLTLLGYELCTEEIQLRDGTHEIYTKYKD